MSEKSYTEKYHERFCYIHCRLKIEVLDNSQQLIINRFCEDCESIQERIVICEKHLNKIPNLWPADLVNNLVFKL